jgi:hypothetical protein
MGDGRTVDSWQMARQYKDLAKNLNADPNLHFVIREDDLDIAITHPELRMVEMVLKKAALYAKRGIILTKPKTFFHATGLAPNPNQADWSSAEISVRLKELYEQFNRASGFSETFYFIPERIIDTVEHWEDENDWDSPIETTCFEFSTEYRNTFGVDMSFSDPAVNSHIFENLQCSSNELSVINVWLPQLVNVPLDVLLRLREDESDSFTRFHFALRKLITDAGDMDSERKVKELFQLVDYEVRSFEAEMNTVRKKRALKAYEAIVGFSIMGLSLALPTPVAQIVLSVIGAYQGKEFIGYLFREREQMYDRKSSDFYVPWLCTKKEKET